MKASVMQEAPYLKRLVTKLIEELKRPLAQEDVAYGWRPDLQNAMVELFHQMLCDLQNGIDISQRIEYFTVARALDHMGIEEGRLAQHMIDVSDAVLRIRNGLPQKELSWMKQ